MTSATMIKRYDLNTIREEVFNLLELGTISLDRPLRSLYNYFPAQHWNKIERELEINDYLLRDSVIDLVGGINWSND